MSPLKPSRSDLILYALALLVGGGLGVVFPLAVGPLVIVKPGAEAAFTLVCVLAGSLAASLMLYFVQRIVLRPLSDFSSAFTGLAEGRLDVSIGGKPSGEFAELASRFHRMLASLRATLDQLQGSSSETLSLARQLTGTIQQMHGATEEVSSTIQNISKGAEEQAAKVQEAFELIDAMAGNIQSSTEILSGTQKAVERSRAASLKGTEAVQRAIQQMFAIREVVLSSAKEVNELGSRSKAIGQVVDVITHIADQTNLLALNAAIEAARAGEYGRGFSVVAEEVKKLADGSAEAAQKIARMIREIQKEIDAVVGVMNMGAERVERGRDVVTEAGDSLQEIRAASEEVAEQVQMVSRSFETQADQVGKVVEAITNIVAVSEENASATEEISASTEQLTASMESLVAAAHQLEGVARRLKDTAGIFHGGNG